MPVIITVARTGCVIINHAKLQIHNWKQQVWAGGCCWQHHSVKHSLAAVCRQISCCYWI